MSHTYVDEQDKLAEMKYCFARGQAFMFHNEESRDAWIGEHFPGAEVTDDLTNTHLVTPLPNAPVPDLKSDRVIRRAGANYTVVKPWPVGTHMSAGGNGLVFAESGNYRAAFFEATPLEPATFIRGEGKTIEEAEEAAWAKFQRAAGCVEHEFEARGYKNGAGFCKKCGMFKSKVFTAEELGMLCDVCGEPTFWGTIGNSVYCEEHAPDREERRRLRADARAKGDHVPKLDELFDDLEGED